MSRRRKRTYASGWIDWTPAVAELAGPFQILIGDLTPPGRVRLYDGARHRTFVAKFTDPEGDRGPFTLTMRVPK